MCWRAHRRGLPRRLPASGLRAGLADFSNDLADEGGRDLNVLTLAGLSDVTAVRATRLKVRLSVFNPGGDSVGASAFLDLAFDVAFAGGTTREVTRTGRLTLGRNDGDWQVIGYRVCCYDDQVLQAEAES